MSQEDQASIESSTGSATATSTATSTGAIKNSSALGQVVVAGAILGLVAGALAIYVFASRPASDDNSNQPVVSATEWVGEGSQEIGTSSSGQEPDSTTDNEVSTRYAPTEEELRQDQVIPLDTGSQDEGQDIRKGTIQKGTAVMTSLTALGLTNSQAHSVIAALDGIYDFRKARPGHTFEIHRDIETGNPLYFRYDVSRVEVYEVRKRGDRLVGKKKLIPTQKRIRRFGGTIASSLYKALVELEAHPSLSGRVVDVFAHEVKFFKAQRPGDTFRVIVEEESLDGEFLGYGPVLALEYNGTKSGKKRLFRFQAGDGMATYYNNKGISVPRSVIVIPLHYTRMSSPFGMRFHPVLKRRILHNGVDFAASYGTPIWACRAGTVTYAGKKGANGNLVIINHGDNLVSAYAHLQRFARVSKKGANVRSRQVIGYVGSTGRSTGPHLHFGLKKNGRFIDPLKYKVQPGKPAPAKYRSELKSIIAKYSRLLDNTPIRNAAAPLAETNEDEVLGSEEL